MSWYLALTPVQALLVCLAVLWTLGLVWVALGIWIVTWEARRDDRNDTIRNRRHRS